MKNNALLIFVKNLIYGEVKTRLAATVGNDVAMVVYQNLLRHTCSIARDIDADKIVLYSDFIEEDIWNNELFKKQLQKGIDLGMRMANAFEISFDSGYEKAIIIGTDCPSINKIIIESAFMKLNDADIVIGPATDGGYYLLGMKKLQPFLFQNMKWSSDTIFRDTIDMCRQNQLNYSLLPELSDVDEEKDLIHLKNNFI